MRLSDLGIGMDPYDRRARLMPALLVILPAALAVIVHAPNAVLGWSGGVALIVQAGGSFLLAQIVGDVGKRKEPMLFEHFGGRPTEMMLCHGHCTNKVLLAERHRKLVALFPSIKIPSAASEKKNFKAALGVYAACIDKLRGMARTDKAKYVDVHRENIHYGFRRNLWAIKPWGILVAAVSTATIGAEMGGRLIAHEPVHLAQPIVAAFNALLLLAWVAAVTRDWVKRAAVLYAERLLEALDSLAA
jgi:hypothetical protein